MISFDAAFQFCSDVPELSAIPYKIVVWPHTGTYTSSYEELVKHEPDETIEPVDGDHTALITFTTGSSGKPKGADRTHQFLAAQHYAIDNVIPYGDQDIDMPAFPIFSLNNIAAGVTSVLPCTDVAQPAPDDPIKLASQILSCGINNATLSISMISGLVEYSKQHDIKLEGLKRVVTGGAPVSNDLLTGFLKVVPESDVMLLYGSTEAEPMAHIEAKEILFPRHARKINGGMVEEGVNVGFFADDLDAKFVKIHKGRIELGEDGWEPWELMDGEPGELLVSALHVCKRYYNNTEATKDTKVYEPDGKVWHRTGDIGYRDEHGQVWIVGRVHNIIVRDGKPQFPVRVEIALKRIEPVEKSAFVGIPDSVLGEKAHAVVKPSRDLTQDEKQTLIKNIEQDLAQYGIPHDGVIVTDDIPMDPRHHSKVEYPILRQRIISGDLS
jgi:acyl-CoA synthetase (AMP-forming)/AMP-acid ligase II